MLRHLTLILFLCCLIGGLDAQNNDEVEIITFDDDGPKSSIKTKNLKSLLIVKSSPLSFLFGWQFIELEYPLTEYLTIEGGIGVTFQPIISEYQNIYADIYFEEYGNNLGCESPNYESDYNYCDQKEYSNYNIRNTKLGPWLSGALKLYLYNAPDDVYLSLNLKYHRDNYRIFKVEENIDFIRTSDDFDRENVNNLDYTVRLGYQALFSPLTADFFIGLGIRSINQNRLDVGFDTTKGTWTNSSQNLVGSALLLESGVRIGLEFAKHNPTSKSSGKRKKRRRRR